MPGMSDNPPPYSPPPPPPPSAPPPPGPPGYGLPPNYQGPTAPDYTQAYQQQAWQQQPASPGMMAAAGAGGIMYQLGGPAAWSIGFGLVSIVVPFVSNYYFPILPIAGIISAIRAMQRGRFIGGVIGIVVNVIGGIVSLIWSGLILR
jgi:hypothetical protein